MSAWSFRDRANRAAHGSESYHPDRLVPDPDEKLELLNPELDPPPLLKLEPPPKLEPEEKRPEPTDEL